MVWYANVGYKILKKYYPEINESEIKAFLEKYFKVAHAETGYRDPFPLSIHSLVYLERYHTRVANERLDLIDVIRASLIIATKIIIDQAVYVEDFHPSFGLDINRLKQIESKFLGKLNFEVCVLNDHVIPLFQNTDYWTMNDLQEILHGLEKRERIQKNGKGGLMLVKSSLLEILNTQLYETILFELMRQRAAELKKLLSEVFPDLEQVINIRFIINRLTRDYIKAVCSITELYDLFLLLKSDQFLIMRTEVIPEVSALQKLNNLWHKTDNLTMWQKTLIAFKEKALVLAREEFNLDNHFYYYMQVIEEPINAVEDEKIIQYKSEIEKRLQNTQTDQHPHKKMKTQ